MKTINGLAKNPDIWCGLNSPEMNEETADAVLFGIPFDEGVSYRGGTKEAPDTLRANTKTSSPSTERFEYFDKFNIFDAGNFVGDDREEMFAEIQSYVRDLVTRGKKFCMIGGDHSVTIPVERGINDAVSDDFGIIHVDAHFDLDDHINGDKLSHGSTERRALELEHISSTENLYFIAIRNIEPGEYEFAKDHEIQVKSARDCYAEGMEAVAADCVEKMKKFSKVYLTFDIDALDPGFAGGTGTPQFGGITPRMALTLFEKLFTQLNIIGFDIVEIAPPLDDSLASMYAGRKLLTEAWGYWADQIGKLEKLSWKR